ncbi:MAG: trypsin-like peptidase domain-containing protein [Rhodanobacteraceae bacterium]|nr:trypsin-like peptidase domain-containing protein [Rhodanobacteraceae bacterium]
MDRRRGAGAWRGWICAALFAAVPAAAQSLVPPPAPPEGAVSPAAERVYAAARPSLLQVRTLVEAAGRQSSIGSGFLVGADGLAITNYHVVAQYALEPATYRLEYARPDGTQGALRLLAIDVAHDLAVVRLDGAELPYLRFDAAAVAGELPRGERAWAMGNPLDLGFTIVEGTWNGRVERSYDERVHFTGAINPGMSGGPAVGAGGTVVGINVAKRLDGELVSFLVPARHAAALLERARSEAPLDLAEVRTEIGRQLLAWQDGFYSALDAGGLRTSAFGPYRAPESASPWFTCWARTNTEQRPKPRASLDGSSCSSQSTLFVADDIGSGSLEYSHAYARSRDLNAFQFATFVSKYQGSALPGGWSRKRLTAPECREAFVAPADAASAPPLRAVWCARAYRDFAGLYDVALTTVTQDRAGEALVSRLSMQGVSYANALAFGRRFVGAIAWTP